MWVVKIGGSLASSDTLLRWLDIVNRAGRGCVVVVPGGGSFADQVRTNQAKWRFDDATAHHMALLAMEQYGLMLIGLQPALVAARTADAIKRVLREERVPVWLPATMVLDEVELPASWAVTSDSLAAWLAMRLGASALVLVKSIRLDEAEVSANELARLGVVDQAFPSLMSREGPATWICAREQYDSMSSTLRGETTLGTRVVH